MFTNFLPSSVYEWVLFVVCFILIVMLLLYNKAILKCKDLIEGYVEEIRKKDNKIAFYEEISDGRFKTAFEQVGDVDD